MSGNQIEVKKCSGYAFFEKLEESLGYRIPKDIKKILLFNYYDSAVTLSKLDETSIKDMENVLRYTLKQAMLADDDTIGEYLCRFKNDQTNFEFIGGQLKILKSIAEYCQQLLSKDNVLPATTGHPTVNHSGNETAAETPSHAQVLLKQLHDWIQKKNSTETVISGDFRYRLDYSTFKENTKDQSISYNIKCVVVGCDSLFKVSRKAYDTYYTRKSDGKKPQKKRAPKWNLSAIQSHLRKVHSTISNNSQSDSSDDSIDDDSHVVDDDSNSANLNNQSADTNQNLRHECTVRNPSTSSSTEGSSNESIKDSSNARKLDPLPRTHQTSTERTSGLAVEQTHKRRSQRNKNNTTEDKKARLP